MVTGKGAVESARCASARASAVRLASSTSASPVVRGIRAGSKGLAEFQRRATDSIERAARAAIARQYFWEVTDGHSRRPARPATCTGRRRPAWNRTATAAWRPQDGLRAARLLRRLASGARAERAHGLVGALRAVDAGAVAQVRAHLSEGDGRAARAPPHRNARRPVAQLGLLRRLLLRGCHPLPP